MQRLTDTGTGKDTQNDFDEIKGDEGEDRHGERRPQRHVFVKAVLEIAHEPYRPQSIAADKTGQCAGDLAHEVSLLCQAEAREPGHDDEAQIVAADRRKEDTDASLPHGKDRDAKHPKEKP